MGKVTSMCVRFGGAESAETGGKFDGRRELGECAELMIECVNA